LVGDGDGRVSVVAATNAAARDKGLSANTVLGGIGPILGGKGGGKDDLAQGGGTNIDKIDEALALVPSLLR